MRAGNRPRGSSNASLTKANPSRGGDAKPTELLGVGRATKGGSTYVAKDARADGARRGIHPRRASGRHADPRDPGGNRNSLVLQPEGQGARRQRQGRGSYRGDGDGDVR